jgi:hypothetical protein
MTDDKQAAQPARQPKSLTQFFRESPLVGVYLELDREPDGGREIDLLDGSREA